MYLSHSELKQLDLLKRKKPAERFLLMAQLIGEQFEAMKAGIRYQNPKIGTEELEKCLRAKMMQMYLNEGKLSRAYVEKYVKQLNIADEFAKMEAGR